MLALGRATRLIRFLPEAPKVYEGTILLGITTDTDDLAGRVVGRSPRAAPGFEEAREAARGLVGKQLQIPPAVSAKKVGGERLYRKARRGEAVEPPPARLEVFDFDVREGDRDGVLRFRVTVSKGTYVRSLARDLGARLGCGGTLAELRRTAIGPFDVSEAEPPPETGADFTRSPWNPATRIPLDRIPLTLPSHRIESGQIERFAHGGQLPAPGGAKGWVRVADAEDRILGVGELLDGTLTPRIVLADPAG